MASILNLTKAAQNRSLKIRIRINSHHAFDGCNMTDPRPSKILIVDDTAHVVSLLKHYVKKGGYDVLEARDGKEAIETAKAEVPDLILLDAMMPGIDGFDVCKELRSHEKTRFVPIIMITALGEISDKLKALESGVDDFLTKPVDETILIAKVRSLLRAKQQREELEQLKTNFTSMLIHDLRAPLTSILGFTELLLAEKGAAADKQERNFLEIIFDSGEKMLELINDFLDYAKIEAGRFQMNKFFHSIELPLDAAVKSISVLAEKKNIRIIKLYAKEAPQLLIDAQKIEQVAINLLSNAVKFTPQGGRMTVSTAVSDGFVAVSVQDSGVGIRREEMRYLFQPYIQTQSAARSRYRGTGLGLLIVKMIVEAHGGSVKVESEVDVGSKFTFTIPITVQESNN